MNKPFTPSPPPICAKEKCGICSRTIACNHNFILCSACHKKIHIKCNGLNKYDHKKYQKSVDKIHFCMNCLKNNMPFSSLNDNEFYIAVTKGVLNSKNSEPSFTPSDYQKRIIEQFNWTINNNAFDLDAGSEENEEEIIPALNCNYYSIEEFSSAKFSSSKNFSVLHYNIHSIERHIDEFRLALDVLNYKFDIICISESKIIKDYAPKVDITIDGYQTPVGTPTESTKGGVLIYVKNNLKFKPRPDLMMYEPKVLESYFVEIINKNQANDIVGVVYRHPCMNETTFNEHYLKDLVDKLSNVNKKVFIAGDFNFNLLNTNEHEETFAFFDTMMSNFLLPVINLPTKINRINSSLIDNIFTNHLHPDAKSGNLSINMSDGHLPSFLILPKQNQNHLPKKHAIYKRNDKNFSIEKFISDFDNKNWDQIIDIDQQNVNYSMENFTSNFSELMNKHLPLKKITQKQFKQKFKPWITNEILMKISEKTKLNKKYVQTKSVTIKEGYHTKYKKIKNEITFLIRSGKKKYYEKYFTDNKYNLKKVWKGIKQLINIKSKNFDTPTNIETDGKLITDPVLISNSFNEYFTSVADNILSKRKYQGSKSFRDFLSNRLLENFVFEECTIENIRDIIRAMNAGKSSGPNSIPTHILKGLDTKICGPLQKIFNLSLRTGVHPDLLKVSKTIPVYKKGSRLLVSNYRPISLLSNLNKILEKLVHARIYEFLENNHSIYSLQFGFRKKHSADHALIEITEKIRNALDNKQIACGIYVDLQKAFDTVNHDILIAKLEHYGIRGTANDWFSSYLKNRSQYVSILGFDSTTKPLKHGVPQGSVLGPLLFLIYINDLHSSIKHCKVFHFADDTNLLKIDDSIKKMEKLINVDLKILYNWLLANKISLNCDKTELIFFRKPGYKVPDMKIKMNGHRIIPSKNIKYLGIYIDQHLNFNFHCEMLSKKLKRANGMLSKARHYLETANLKNLYYAIFSSHLTYGCQVWAQNVNVHNTKIFNLQKRALRILTFSDNNEHSNPLFSQLSILKLADQVKLKNCVFVHNTLNKTSPHCFEGYFSLLSDIHTVNTRQSSLGCIYVNHNNTVRYGLNSITKKSIIDWNFFCKQFINGLNTFSVDQLKTCISSYFLIAYLCETT